jgi:hypothetical protein
MGMRPMSWSQYGLPEVVKALAANGDLRPDERKAQDAEQWVNKHDEERECNADSPRRPEDLARDPSLEREQ